MKLLIYQPRASYYVGGGEVVAINQARYLIKIGFDVYFVTSKASWLSESDAFKKFKQDFSNNILQIDIPDNLKYIYDIEAGSDWKRWDLESIHFGLYVKEFIKDIKYNLGICHLPLDLVALNNSQKNIIFLHGYPASLNYACELILHNQHEYIAVSKKVKDEWQRLLGNVNIDVVYNGVDTEYFSPSNQIDKKYDVLFVGRLIESKGILNLLDAFKDLIKIRSYLKLALVGTGPLKNKIDSYIVENHLSSNVESLGYLSETTLLDTYRLSKIAVLPSLSREGVLTTALEATACGLPVVTSKGLSLEEYIRHGKNGFLVNTSEKKEIISTLEYFFESNTLLSEMSIVARDISIEWDWNKKIKELKKIILKYE
ncbi:MAG: glycosyltransferase family 4 protein [Patescibacteria group bacterium]